MLVVDPWEWLEKDGSLPVTNRRLRRQALRLAQLIEAGGPLPARHMRETLVACSRRFKGRACPGLMWVAKADDDSIHGYCPVCGGNEWVIRNWQHTDWAEGPMLPAPMSFGAQWDTN